MANEPYILTTNCNYEEFDIHNRMLMDKIRVNAFRKAIEAFVRPGMTVLDVGAGTGILSLLAARAGAAKVYAVEPTTMAENAKDLIRINGFDSVIQVVVSGIEKAELPEKADVVVFEWMGGYGVDEGMLPLFLLARDRWLKPGGKMIPEKVSSWMAPVYDRELMRDWQFWNSKPYGFDFRRLWEHQIDDWHYGYHVGGADMFAEPRMMWSHDSYTTTLEDAKKPYEVKLTFPVLKGGEVNGLVVWFDSDVGGGAKLGNAPGAEPTHFAPATFAFDHPYMVNPGSRIEVEFTFHSDGTGMTRSGMSVSVDGGAWERHNDHRGRK